MGCICYIDDPCPLSKLPHVSGKCDAKPFLRSKSNSIFLFPGVNNEAICSWILNMQCLIKK